MDFPAGFDYFIVGDVFMRKYPSYFNANDNTVSFQVANDADWYLYWLFVYKKSKEQFIIENVKSFFFFNFGEVNFFSVNFLCWFLKHFIYLSSSVKVLIKKCIFLK